MQNLAKPIASLAAINIFVLAAEIITVPLVLLFITTELKAPYGFYILSVTTAIIGGFLAFKTYKLSSIKIYALSAHKQVCLGAVLLITLSSLVYIFFNVRVFGF